MEPNPITANNVPAQRGQTIYPSPYDAVVKGRLKRKLGDYFQLSNFGVNLTELAPGSASALAHCHSKQDEFIFVLAGTLTLLVGDREFELHSGDCYGFKAGTGIAHQLINRSPEDAVYLEVGDRTAGDQVTYPNDDLKVCQQVDGSWAIYHRDGQPY